jgi:hypothetical protein
MDFRIRLTKHVHECTVKKLEEINPTGARLVHNWCTRRTVMGMVRQIVFAGFVAISCLSV